MSDKELVANISISGTAPLERYDIAVTTPRGKKGVGIEKFEVKSTGQPVPTVREAATYTYQELDLHSDGNSVYRESDGCVGAAFIDVDTVAHTRSANKWIETSRKRRQNCRELNIRLDEQIDPITGQVTAVSPILDKITTFEVHLEGPAAGTARFNFQYCMGSGKGMRFNPDPETYGIVGSTHLKVDTLELGRSWRVYTDESTVAGCWVDVEKGIGVADTTFWRVELDFVVTKDP